MDRDGEKRSRRIQVSRDGCELVALRGDREATVYGCRRIVRYGTEEIRLAMHRKTLAIFGDRLVCTSFSGGTVTVEGEIRSVEYSKKTEA